MKHLLCVTLCFAGLTACAVPAEETTDLKPAPEFDLAAFPEGMLNSESLKGKVVVVDFWATWCVPCVKEIPDLNALYHEQDPDRFAIIGVTIESGGYEDVAGQLPDFDIDYPVVMGTENVVNGFGGVVGYPTKFVVSPDWKIYKRYLGGDVKDQIEQDILELTGVAQAF